MTYFPELSPWSRNKLEGELDLPNYAIKLT